MDIKTWETATVTIKVDYDRCNGNGTCVELCPVNVFELIDGKTTAPDIEECIECCACAENCPEEAIEHSSC